MSIPLVLQYANNDKKSLGCRWRWLGELKQCDGGFRMSIGGEEDVR